MKKAFTKNEISDIAKEILSFVELTDTAEVLALSGDLGAGKTTLTQEIGRQLGVNANIISPTFVIMKEYDITSGVHSRLIHIDAYRLDSSSELERLGWKEIISNPKNLVLIEWPEKVEDLIPKKAKKISLSHKDENVREVETGFDF